MDKEQAKFILRSFRPDGADVGDEDFAAALAIATEDRELSEWLAQERAFDAVFAEAVAGLPMPPSLRENILASLATHAGDLPGAADSMDAAMIGSFAMIQPPVSLRAGVIAAMEQSAATRVKANHPWRKLAVPIAAAAGITLAVLLHRPAGPGVIVAEPTVPVDVVQASFIRTFESPQFAIGEKREEPSQSIEQLEGKKLPCPKHFPKGLRGVQSAGCRELSINGKRGSLVCFDASENGIIHMVIFRRSDVCGDLPGKDNPAITQHGNWAVARWLDGDQVYVLFGSTSIKKLTALF